MLEVDCSVKKCFTIYHVVPYNTSRGALGYWAGGIGQHFFFNSPHLKNAGLFVNVTYVVVSTANCYCIS